MNSSMNYLAFEKRIQDKRQKLNEIFHNYMHF